MVKKSAWIAFFVSLFYFASSSMLAQQEKEELKTKLSELRRKKIEMTNEYKENLRKINKQAEDRIATFKTDFRKAREECLADMHKNCEGLRKDFESKLKPMLKEEEELVELVGRDAREDFAKPKAMKMKLE